MNSYLANIGQQAQEHLDAIIQQMVQAQGISEKLKAVDQMAWVGKINIIQASAMEIVNQEIIYVYAISTVAARLIFCCHLAY